MNQIKIGQFLKKLRKEKGLTQEQFAELTDYSKCKEQLLLRKVIAIVTIGMLAWAVSFAFLLMFMNSVTGAGLLLIFEAVMLLLYGAGMLCVKSNCSVEGFLNSVLGAAIALVISNIILAVIFFGTGSYYNHGIVGVYYALLTLFGVFGMTGVVMTVISKKEQKAMK